MSHEKLLLLLLLLLIVLIIVGVLLSELLRLPGVALGSRHSLERRLLELRLWHTSLLELWFWHTSLLELRLWHSPRLRLLEALEGVDRILVVHFFFTKQIMRKYRKSCQ